MWQLFFRDRCDAKIEFDFDQDKQRRPITPKFERAIAST